MPISAEFGNLGTNADGTRNSDYCSICFRNGDFTNPAQTLAEMIESSIDNMTAELGFSPEHASELANNIIPTLGRWR